MCLVAQAWRALVVAEHTLKPKQSIARFSVLMRAEEGGPSSETGPLNHITGVGLLWMVMARLSK